jgi:uncharacterized membrane protein
MRRSRQRERENKTGLAVGLVLVAIALNLFSCSWSSRFQVNSPTAIFGVQDMVGVYAKHDRQTDTMMGMIVPAALMCMGAFFSRD